MPRVDGSDAGPVSDEVPADDVRRASGRWRLLSWPKKVFSGLLAIAAAIGTLGGGVLVVRQSVEWVGEQRDHRNPSELMVTPRLGLQVWQDGTPNKLFMDETQDVSGPVVRIPMEARPFELVFPLQADDADEMAVTAWRNESIFRLEPGTPTSETFLGPGNGLAGYEFGDGSLFLTDEAFHYLVGERIGRRSEDHGETRVASIWWEESRIALGDWREPIFLVCFRDRNGDGVIDVGEYEYLRLEF